MSRRHCHSARRESRPSNCALSNNERHPTARTPPPPLDIYSLFTAYCRIAPNLALFSETRYSPPPPPREKKHSPGSPSVHPKRWPVHPRHRPVYPNLSPTMFEGLRSEFRWHLRSRHRGPKGRSGDTWAEGLLRWLERDSRQDVGVGVFGSVLYRKNGHTQEVNEWNRRVVADFSPHQAGRAERS